MGFKTQPECIPCMIRVRSKEILESSLGPGHKVHAQVQIIERYLGLLRRDADNVAIATALFREVKRLTGQGDPYAATKGLMNRMALQLLPIVESKVLRFEDEVERFRAACAASIAGNLFDVGVLNHSYEPLAPSKDFEFPRLAIDQTAEIRGRLLESQRVLYLCDNAGEIAFDKVLVREVKRLGARVVVAVKGGCYQNDATMEDALTVGMEKVADDVITTGTDASGLELEEFSDSFLGQLEGADFVILKGMAYCESSQDFKAKTRKDLALLLAAKCEPVARFLKVGRGDAAAILIE